MSFSVLFHFTGTININKKDYYGKTPLYWAAYKGHAAAINELIKFGADVNTRCRHGGTPLHSVVSLYPECALLLIQVNKLGRTHTMHSHPISLRENKM